MRTLEWMIPSEFVEFPAMTVYRTRFHFDRKSCFRLRWTADEHADLFLNGRRVADGPARGTAKRWFMETLELELEPGDYVLTARVLMFGSKMTSHSQCSKAFGFYAEPEGLQLDWEWQKFDHVTWSAPLIDWGVYPRAEISCDANWAVLDGKGGTWNSVAFRSDERPLFDNPLPAMERVVEKGYRLVEFEKNKTLFIFDTYVCVWSDFRFSGTGSVTIRWAESFFEPGSFDLRKLIGVKGDRRIYENREWVGNGNRLEITGKTIRWCDFWWNAGRYMMLEFSGNVKLNSVEFHSTGYPWKREWSAHSSAPALDTALEMAWHTLRMCSHTTFIDCPFFEQIQYVSDTRLEALSMLVTTTDDRLILASLQAFADTQTRSGLIVSRTPSKYQQYIPAFALIYILYLQDIALWRSPKVVQKFIPCARKILHFFAQIRQNGLIHLPGWHFVDTPEWQDGDPGWNFIDWVDGWDCGTPPGDCTLNIFYLLALEAMMKLDPVHIREYRRNADEMATLIHETYEVPGKGYAENEEYTHFTEHAQCLAILSDRLTDYAPDLPGAAEASVSFSFYYLEAVRKINRPDLFRKRLQKWLSLKSEGLCTLPENFSLPRSDCHAWSSHILYHYFASIIGLRPVDVTMGCWELQPFVLDLAEVSGKLPLGEGYLQVKIVQKDGEKFLSCEFPPEFHISLNGKKLENQTEALRFS